MFGKSPFGASTTSTTAFGAGSSLFGSTTPKPNVGFGSQATTQTGGLFGQKLFGSPSAQPTSIFGSTQPASTASSSLFGQPKPLFGAATTQSSTFPGTTSLFGSTQATTTGGLFGSGFGTSTPAGTTIKFEPPTATDTMLRNNTNQTITTKHMCITAMKQYESKSLEELRCEDYIANRRGVQTGGSLTFGQAAQPSTSTGLFGSTATSTQSGSLFGQSKPLFGTSTGAFGATTTTSSLFGNTQPTTTASLFGASKPTLGGGLFGSTAATSTASPFGHTQTGGTGLFGAKPATGFGGQSTLFGGTSTFGATASTGSPFSFSTTTQPATSAFSGFGQPAASTASTGLFGSKPAGFGAFSSTAATPFGAQPTTGGLFGSKPATGGLFGSNTVAGGSLFGAPAATSAPSLFGSTAAKPTTSLFGSAVGQPAFGAAPATASVVATPTPIVLGADVSETLIQNALIEAQIAATPYGDSPLLKLLSQDSLQKADLPNPASVERQMRFLAKRSGAVTTTTASGPTARGSIPAAGSRVSVPQLLKSRSSKSGDFSYHPVFSSPNLSRTMNGSGASPIVSLNTTADRSTLLKEAASVEKASGTTVEGAIGDLNLQSRPRSNVKRLDLSLLHRSIQESRSFSESEHRASSGGSDSVVANRDDSAISGATGERRGVDGVDGSGGARAAVDVGGSSGTPMVGTRRAHEQRHVEVQKEVPPRLNFDVSSASSKGSEVKDSPLLANISSRPSGGEVSLLHTSPRQKHPGGIYLERRDYECEPSLRELAVMAERNGGVCHIEDGFTVRRLAFGSVFWPGPLDINDIDLDKVIHFRQNEVVVYADESTKPPVGVQLNRFAEISLERVWHIDKATKEYVKDPIRLEEIGFRTRLERVCLRMGATFKDYRPETGIWVFTVPHFTKYGLPEDSDDEDMPTMEALLASRLDSQVQSSVQRCRLVLDKESPVATNQKKRTYEEVSTDFDEKTVEDDVNGGVMKSVAATEARMQSARGLGGITNFEEDFKLNVRRDSTAKQIIDDWDTEQSATVEPLLHGYDTETFYESKVIFESDARLDELMENSELMKRVEEQLKDRKIALKRVEPKHDLDYIVEKSEVFSLMGNFRISQIDDSLLQGRRTRIGWGPGERFAKSGLPKSFAVDICEPSYPEDIPDDYLIDMFEHNLRLSARAPFSSDAAEDETFIQQVKPSRDFPQLIDSFIATSEQSSRAEELLVWKLCHALFTDPSHFNITSEAKKTVARRDSVGAWLRTAVAVNVRAEKPKSGCKRILQLLRRGQLKAAMECSVRSKRPLVAIALSTFQYSPRDMYKKQVAHWESTGAIEFIDEDLLKVYLIMAGETSIEVRGRRIFVNDGLDWQSALGMFVWYICDDTLSLGEVIDAFEKDVNERGALASLQLPLPLELIKLACDRSHPMEALLDPLTFTIHPLDFHLSWHLWSVLRSIGYAHLAPDAERNLHVSYAEQLIARRLPYLAVFVLSHIPDDSSRQSAVLDVMSREAVNVDDTMFAKFETVSKLPYAVIARTKYLRAAEVHDELNMCVYALESGMYDEAHSLFFDRVAPNAVNMNNFEILGTLSECFEAKSHLIAGWGPRGQLFTDFFHLKRSLREIDDDAKVDDLLELANSLASRLVSITGDTPAQRMSIVKMSRLVYEMMCRFEGQQLSWLPLSLDEALNAVSQSPARR